MPQHYPLSSYIADPVYFNGQYIPLAEAHVSPLDRGFLFGDGVYEVIPVYSRSPFRIDEHLKRLATTLAAIQLPISLSLKEWKTIIEQLVTNAPWEDQSIYIQITRGADIKRDHAFPPSSVTPSIFAFSSPLITPSEALRNKGISAITLPDLRWSRCDLKVTSLLPNVLARQEAIERGCVEALLIRDGFLKEGAASNIFIVKEGTLLAPPKTQFMLPGITYDVVLELAQNNQLPIEIREIDESELHAADEVWMTSSTKEILAITELDSNPVGTGKPGPYSKLMWNHYQIFKNDVMRKR